MSSVDLDRAGEWLARHGLVDARPTPLLAGRLAARHRARTADNVLMAALLVAAALALATVRMTDGRASGTAMLLLAGLMVVVVLAKLLLDWWVRRVDRHAAATLPRRVTHPVQLGWRVAPGLPYAVFAVAVFAASTVLALSAVTARDSTIRSGAVILLIGLAGVAAGIVVQLHDVLTRPVVAEDEDSLAADVVMRVEDARERVAPSVVWAMPGLLLLGDSLGWWYAAAIILVLAASIAFHLVRTRAAPARVVAGQVTRPVTSAR